ncbi:related to stress response RCI peptide [Ramularia collo-cygni]|uniref:Related to stress response RCI peptide n=1 Tax=Ramularia collo-cygni TaxID=112498 RepID=A0A2D3URG3_9PEZI|nr:related to stress response RCI peptide [Ramularia collo-cygni]CZT18581.1 related to stress response RCI peptide [Ramularia collo-cygni]
MCGSDVFLAIVAILFPPIAVWVKRGICSADSLINLALCCLGFLPGLVHAWYIISTYPEPTYHQVPQDAERGNVTHYYVQTQPSRRPEAPHGYGTVNSTVDQQFPGQQQGVVQPKSKAVAAPRQQQAGPSEEVPPSYAQAVGDHKVQGP